MKNKEKKKLYKFQITVVKKKNMQDIFVVTNLQLLLQISYD